MARSLLQPWFAAVLAAFLVAALAVQLTWSGQGWFTPTGDEPFYLAIADSLATDRSLEVTDAWERNGLLRDVPPADMHVVDGSNGLYSVHNVGLPSTLAVPYALFGLAGARAVMILWAAVAVTMLWLVVSLVVDAPRARALVVLPVAVGLPLGAFSNQIYPDIAAGALMLVGLYVVLRQRLPTSDGRLAAVTAAVAFLPWLQIKYLAPTFVLVAAFGWMLRREGPPTRRRIASLLAPVTVSTIVLALYNWYAFGDPTGPYSDGALVVDDVSGMVLFGLLADQNQGLLVQQPLHLVGLATLGWMLRRYPLEGTVTTLLVLSTLVPNALHDNRYGGFSFIGRFQWSAAVVLCAVAVIGVGLIWRWKPKVAWVVIGAAVAIQLILLAQLLRDEPFLFQKGPLQTLLATYGELFPAFNEVLPAFFDRRWALRYPANWIAVATIVGLLAWGYLRASASRASFWKGVGAIAVASAAALGVSSFASADPDVRWYATQLWSDVGSTAGSDRIAVPADGAGNLTIGPWMTVLPGTYELEVEYSSPAAADAAVGSFALFDQNTGENVASVQLTGTGGRLGGVVVPAELERGIVAQLITRVDGVAEVRLRSITLRSG